jgi:hypothetical protein
MAEVSDAPQLAWEIIGDEEEHVDNNTDSANEKLPRRKKRDIFGTFGSGRIRGEASSICIDKLNTTRIALQYFGFFDTFCI